MFRIKSVLEIESTNTYVKTHKEEFLHGDAIVAAVQTKGRGRLGHSFSCPPGGLYMSIYLDAKYPADEMPFITVLAGVAVRRVVKRYISGEIKLKWINDLYVNDKKLCGILTEYISSKDGDGVVVGIGLNVNSQEGLPEIAVSMKMLENKIFDIKKISAEIASEIIPLYENAEKKVIADEMRQNLYKPSKSMDEWFSRYNL
jgi:BirA family biotin operon repressor/biotin-[acetyl-CoA-carboxylase] ligase